MDEIRKAAGLKNAVLKQIEIDGREIVFRLVTDLTYTAEDVAHAQSIAVQAAPEGYTGRAEVMKSVPSEEGIRRASIDFLCKRYPSVAAFVRPEDVRVETDGRGGRVFIGADESDRARLMAEGVTDALSAELQRTFPGTWVGEFTFTDRDKGEIERELPPEEYIAAPRFFPVEHFEAIDGGTSRSAVYLADLEKEGTGVCVCGTIDHIEERVTKKGKPYFSVSLSDGTAGLRCLYFSRSKTVEKVRDLRPGDSVCLTGDCELRNGALSFLARMIDRGSPPDGFVPEERPSRPVPKQYRVVFPVPETDFVQADMFGEKPLPEEAVKKKFVVFDIETTGLNYIPSAGMDRIIELGAVKVEGGKITERFSTFVACPVRVPDEIVSITGITDEMLVGAPSISDVIADFRKFCDGCELVGHNAAGFDIKFIRYYGEKEGFRFDMPVHDTLLAAQRELRLSNHKLDTVAAYFGFSFRHHRAYDDAFVTAKIFLEMARRRGSII